MLWRIRQLWKTIIKWINLISWICFVISIIAFLVLAYIKRKEGHLDTALWFFSAFLGMLWLIGAIWSDQETSQSFLELKDSINSLLKLINREKEHIQELNDTNTPSDHISIITKKVRSTKPMKHIRKNIKRSSNKTKHK